mmetsp:Transcript_18164/g.40257  ORF Transcript_18164/g.40257 Transcript_18164/m.40257 type:complete len:209 (-) Transcript_18164:585-1211(-)
MSISAHRISLLSVTKRCRDSVTSHIFSHSAKSSSISTCTSVALLTRCGKSKVLHRLALVVSTARSFLANLDASIMALRASTGVRPSFQKVRVLNSLSFCVISLLYWSICSSMMPVHVFSRGTIEFCVMGDCLSTSDQRAVALSIWSIIFSMGPPLLLKYSSEALQLSDCRSMEAFFSATSCSTSLTLMSASTSSLGMVFFRLFSALLE